MEAGELRLRDAKTGPRQVALSPAAVRVLSAIPRVVDNPWVIAGRKPGTRLANLNASWLVVRARAGLEDVRLHDLRHSFASRALALGESLTMIGKLLGHRKVQTTARYAPPRAGLGESIGGKSGGEPSKRTWREVAVPWALLNRNTWVYPARAGRPYCLLAQHLAMAVHRRTWEHRTAHCGAFGGSVVHSRVRREHPFVGSIVKPLVRFIPAPAGAPPSSSWMFLTHWVHPRARDVPHSVSRPVLSSSVHPPVCGHPWSNWVASRVRVGSPARAGNTRRTRAQS